MSSDEDSYTDTTKDTYREKKDRENLWFLNEVGSNPDDDDEEDYRESLTELFDEEEDLDPDSSNSVGGSSLESDEEDDEPNYETEGNEKAKETPAIYDEEDAWTTDFFRPVSQLKHNIVDDMMDDNKGTQKSHSSPKTASKSPKNANKSSAEASDPPETGDERPRTESEEADDGALVVGPEEAKELEDWIISEGINEPLSDIPEYTLLLSLASDLEKNHDILMKVLTPNTVFDDSECEGDEQPMSEDPSTENPETATEVEIEENAQTEWEEEPPEMIIEITDDDSDDLDMYGNDEWPEDFATVVDADEIIEIDDDEELSAISTEVVEILDMDGNDEWPEDPATKVDTVENPETETEVGIEENPLKEIIEIDDDDADDELSSTSTEDMEDVDMHGNDEIILQDPSENDVPQNELPELSPRVNNSTMPVPGGNRPGGIRIDDERPSSSKEAMKALALANASREAMKALPIVHKPKAPKELPPLPGAVPTPPKTEDAHELRVWAQLVSNIIDKQIQYINTKDWNEKVAGISEDKPPKLETGTTAIIDPDLVIYMKEESKLLSTKWLQLFGPESLKNLHRNVSMNAVQSSLDQRVSNFRIMRRPPKRQVLDIQLRYSKIICTVEINHELALQELALRIERSTFKPDIDVIQYSYDTVRSTWIWADGTVMIINGTSQASLVDIQQDLLPKLVNLSINSPPNIKINYLRLASHTSYPWAIDLLKFCEAETLTGPCFPERYVFYVTKDLPGVVARLHKSGEVQVFAMATNYADAMLTKLYYIAAKYRVKDSRSH